MLFLHLVLYWALIISIENKLLLLLIKKYKWKKYYEFLSKYYWIKLTQFSLLKRCSIVTNYLYGREKNTKSIMIVTRLIFIDDYNKCTNIFKWSQCIWCALIWIHWKGGVEFSRAQQYLNFRWVHSYYQIFTVDK